MFQYDRFQQEAIDYIKQNYSVIVSAPTGSGKTAIAEHVITESLAKGEGVIYTAPLKALSNQKFRDFQEQYGDKIGILTGDVSLNPDAPVLIMTTEIFRNKTLEDVESLKKYSWIIFDEVHYLDDAERGTIWEESIMFLPSHMKMLGLSATVPNINELSSWIESIHKIELKQVIEQSRPVPLHFFFQCQNQILDRLNKLYQQGYQAQTGYSYHGRRRFTHTFFKANRLSSLMHYLQEKQALPCIYFAFGRRLCEDLAFELYSFNFLTDEEQKQICSLYTSLCEKFALQKEKSAQRLIPLIKRGIAYHHAGMLPTLKEAIERLFTSRLLKVIFTTETFALGINMPARTVVFGELRKFSGRYYAALKTREFYQMAGRAGRRGMDKEGYVICRVNPRRIQFPEVKRILYGKPEKVTSKFNSSYATLLQLYAKHQERLVEIYPLSFHYFQEKTRGKKASPQMLQSKLALLKELGYIRNQELTVKGRFAAKLYGYELPLAEIYVQNILDELSPVELGILASALVYEPRKHERAYKIPRSVQALNELTTATLKRIHLVEQKFRLWPKSKEYFYHLTQVTEAWLRGTDFSKLGQYTDIDEGELVRHFRMVVQILRQIQAEEVSSKMLKEKIRKLLSVFNRDIIDAEKQLRMK